MDIRKKLQNKANKRNKAEAKRLAAAAVPPSSTRREKPRAERTRRTTRRVPKPRTQFPAPISNDSLAEEAIDWVVPKTMAAGTFTLLAGHAGGGKSTYIQSEAGQLANQGHASLIMTLEDSLTQIVAPRFIAMGVNRNLIFHPSPTARLPRLPGDLPYFTYLVKQCKPRLVVCDLLDSFTQKGLQHGGNVHALLEPLIDLAVAYKFALVGLLHLGKNARFNVTAPLGSVELGGMARSMLLIEEVHPDTETPDEPELGQVQPRPAIVQKVLKHLKSNFVPLQAPRYFHMESVVIDAQKGIEAPLLVWDEDYRPPGKGGAPLPTIEKVSYTLLEMPLLQESRDRFHWIVRVKTSSGAVVTLTIITEPLYLLNLVARENTL